MVEKADTDDLPTGFEHTISRYAGIIRRESTRYFANVARERRLVIRGAEYVRVYMAIMANIAFAYKELDAL